MKQKGKHKNEVFLRNNDQLELFLLNLQWK